ncbi:MAG: endolytic transglycosylase MltG [Patescibacteria group bacterium]
MKVLIAVLVLGGIGVSVLGVGVWRYWQRFSEPAPVIESLKQIKVTFPEGWRNEEMALRLQREGVIANWSEYTVATSSSAVAPKLREQYKLSSDASLTGFLFPDTYQFVPFTEASLAVEKQITAFESRTAQLELTYDTVILASIVEREAKFDDDRAQIAGVYANRLREGMPLQADPTVQFAKVFVTEQACLEAPPSDSLAGACATFESIDWWPVVTRADLSAIQSPFNTYLHSGLPPEPICNPGLASLAAAAAPAVHTFFYFVSDTEGRAHFAKTLAEHNANVAKYR